MAVQLPNVQQPFVEPNTGLVNRTWYLALLNLNNQVQAQVVTSVTLVGTNGITAGGGTITSSGQFTVSLAPTGVVAATYGTSTQIPVFAVNATGQITSASTIALSGNVGTVTNVVVTGANGIGVAGSPINSAGTIALSIGNLTCTNVATTGTVTAVNVQVSSRVSSASVVADSFITTPKTFVSNFTRVMSVASGNQAITGVGFKPKAVIFLGSVVNGAANDSCKGFSDGTRNFCLLDYTTSGANWATTFLTANCIYLFDDVATANFNSATIASLDSDGFTVAWVKGNTPTSTMTIGYMAIG